MIRLRPSLHAVEFVRIHRSALEYSLHPEVGRSSNASVCRSFTKSSETAAGTAGLSTERFHTRESEPADVRISIEFLRSCQSAICWFPWSGGGLQNVRRKGPCTERFGWLAVDHELDVC